MNPLDSYHYIVIEGNIGAGKTSFATRLAGELQAALILEQFEENSFLPRFYEDPVRYAFPLELSFLADRYQQLKNHFSAPGIFNPVTVSDYFIFKSLIFASQNLEITEYALYQRFFQLVSSVVPKPDLVLFLWAEPPELQANIRKRGRSYEQNIPDDYLRKIQTGYLDFFKQQRDMRILLVETSGMDFVSREEDYSWLKHLVHQSYPAGITIIRDERHSAQV